MTLKTELMAFGIHANPASGIGFDVPVSGLVATGLTAAAALVLTQDFSIFATVSASASCILPPARNKGPQAIYNGGASPLTVYPSQTGPETINGAASFQVPNGKSAVFFGAGNAWIANASA